jgi:hypothetical protein
MIRIDEIYTNTFWPWLKKNVPGTRMFVCDPFGRSDPDSVIDFGSHPHQEHNYVFFFDQEPLNPQMHLPTFEKIALNCRDIYYVNYTVNKSKSQPGYLVTSEKNSEPVDTICKKFGWRPLYYFFHGWAALDWYRGYDRTFLMLPPEQRTITHTMLMPNRIIAGQRQHRLILYYNFLKKHLNFKNCLISFPAVCPGENLPVEVAVQPLKEIYPDISEIVSSKDLPLQFKNENDHPMRSCWLDLFDEGASSLLYLVTETLAQGQRLHLTEKTFKPICMRMPFVLAGTRGSLRYLRSYGFRTFGHVWDESYDDEPNDVLRMERIANLIVSLDELPNSAKQELFFECLETVEHNYRHFYDGTFERILWRELTDMMEGMGV